MRLSEDMRYSLSEKLKTTNFVIAQQKNSMNAEKIAPTIFPEVGSPEFISGTFEGDEGLFRPWQVQISNRWQGWDGDVKVQVLVGKQSTDPQEGVIFIWRSDATDSWQSYAAPDGIGGLRIISITGSLLTLQSEDGKTLVFDWKNGKY